MGDARLLTAGLEQLLAAVHADDPKREILVRVGDAIREATALAEKFQAVVDTLKIEQAPRLAAQQDGAREDKLGMLRDTLERLVMHRKDTPGLHYDNKEQLLESAISHAEMAVQEIDALRSLEQEPRHCRTD